MTYVLTALTDLRSDAERMADAFKSIGISESQIRIMSKDSAPDEMHGRAAEDGRSLVGSYANAFSFLSVDESHQGPGHPPHGNYILQALVDEELLSRAVGIIHDSNPLDVPHHSIVPAPVGMAPA